MNKKILQIITFFLIIVIAASADAKPIAPFPGHDNSRKQPKGNLAELYSVPDPQEDNNSKNVIFRYSGIQFGKQAESGTPPDYVAGLDNLIKTALRNNPELRAYEDRFHSRETRPERLGSLPDPMVGLSVMNVPTDSFRFDRTPMSQKKIFFSQMVPFPGKLQLKKEIARYEAEAAEYMLKRKEDQVTRGVKDVFYKLYFNKQATEITRKNKTILELFERIAESRYSVGKGLQQDVLKAQVEISKMNDRLIRLYKQKIELRARMAQLLGSDGFQEKIDFKDVVQTRLPMAMDEYKKLLLKHQPVLKFWKKMIERHKSDYALARKEYAPDFNLGASYGQREKNPDIVSITLGLIIPLYARTKQDNRVKETKLNISAAEETYNASLDEFTYQLENCKADIDKNDKLISLFRTGIIPQAEQSLQSARAGYEVDKVDFLTLLNNEITLFNYEIQYYRVVTDYESNIANLEEIIGKRFY